MDRVKQALDTGKPVPGSKRRYGDRWQEGRRKAERAVRVAAITFRRWVGKRNVPRALAAKAMGIPERTLTFWEAEWRSDCLKADPRGRPAERSPVDLRNLVTVAFNLMGPHVGVPVLRLLLPEMPKRELEDMTRRYKALCARKRRLALYSLHWLRPGTVWAIDHSKPPAPVDGVYPALLAVRDLATGQQLAWQPVPDETAKEVERVVESLIVEHGAPLLIKKDNGSALNEADLNAMLEKNGVTDLLSPVKIPAYNGAIESGIGSMKTRTQYQAALHGRPGLWTSDDCEAARLQANLTARPLGITGPTPEESWNSRQPISPDLRQRFQNLVATFDEQERRAHGHLPGIDPNQAPAPSARRIAIRRALVASRLLDIRKGGITLPIRG